MRWFFTYYSTPLYDNPLHQFDGFCLDRPTSPMATVDVKQIGRSGMSYKRSELVDTRHILSEAIENWLGEAKAKSPVSSRKQKV